MSGFLNTLWSGTKSGASFVGNKISSGYKAAHDSSLGKSFRQTMGSVEKAVIEIADFSKRVPDEEPANAPGGKAGAGVGIAGLGGFDADLAGNYGATLGKLKAAKDKITKKVTGFTDENDEAFDINTDFQKFRFEVPFNPSELTLTGYGGEEMMVQNFSNRETENREGDEEGEDGHHRRKRANSISAVSSHIELTIPLQFDKTNNQDAFYGDKFTLGATNVARGVSKLVGNTVTGGGNYSVQNEVEAFTYIMRNKNMHLMRFTWGDMSYQGILNGVNAEYTMFNVNGEPCRATVSLRMVLLDDEYTDQKRIWVKNFRKNVGVTDQSSLQGAIGNLGVH